MYEINWDWHDYEIKTNLDDTKVLLVDYYWHYVEGDWKCEIQTYNPTDLINNYKKNIK